MDIISNENAYRSLNVTGKSDIVHILCLKGLHLDLAKYVVLQTYKGCGVDTLKVGEHWLFSHHEFYPLNDGKRTWNKAAYEGFLDVVKLLHMYGVEGCTKKAMDCAAKNGHLEVVKWLHKNRSEGCTKKAMNCAAENGHLEVVKWLHKNRSEGCTKKAMDYAAARGHLEVVKWLHEHRNEGCSYRAMDLAAEYGHLEVLKWLHKHRDEKCSYEALDWAEVNEHLEVLMWLFDNGLAYGPEHPVGYEYLESILSNLRKREESEGRGSEWVPTVPPEKLIGLW